MQPLRCKYKKPFGFMFPEPNFFFGRAGRAEKNSRAAQAGGAAAKNETGGIASARSCCICGI